MMLYVLYYEYDRQTIRSDGSGAQADFAWAHTKPSWGAVWFAPGFHTSSYATGWNKNF